MVGAERDRHHRAGDDVVAANNRAFLGGADGEDADFGGVDDRGELPDAERAEVADGEVAPVISSGFNFWLRARSTKSALRRRISLRPIWSMLRSTGTINPPAARRPCRGSRRRSG